MAKTACLPCLDFAHAVCAGLGCFAGFSVLRLLFPIFETPSFFSPLLAIVSIVSTDYEWNGVSVTVFFALVDFPFVSEE